MNINSNDNALKWQCRRGMLELDVILIPFLETYYSELDRQEQAYFRDLLEAPDPDLFNWLMGYSKPDNLQLEHVVDTIREKVGYHH